MIMTVMIVQRQEKHTKHDEMMMKKTQSQSHCSAKFSTISSLYTYTHTYMESSLSTTGS